MLAFEMSAEQRELKDAARRFAATEMIPVAARHDDEQIYEGTSQVQRVVIARNLLKG
jgi:alkylation response protein AidB-like acyl-CoA dehydrogenase